MNTNENNLDVNKCKAIRSQILYIVRDQQIKTKTDKETKRSILELIERIVDGK